MAGGRGGAGRGGGELAERSPRQSGEAQSRLPEWLTIEVVNCRSDDYPANVQNWSYVSDVGIKACLSQTVASLSLTRAVWAWHSLDQWCISLTMSETEKTDKTNNNGLKQQQINLT